MIYLFYIYYYGLICQSIVSIIYHKQSAAVSWHSAFNALANHTHHLLVLAALQAERKPATEDSSEDEQTETPEVSGASSNSSWEAVSIISANWTDQLNDISLVVWNESLIVWIEALIVRIEALVVWIEALVVRVKSLVVWSVALVTHEDLICWHHVWILILGVVRWRRGWIAS